MEEICRQDWDVKILQITMIIQENYPELSKYIEEMRETIPDEKRPAITAIDQESYYNSLNSMLEKYISVHNY